MNLRITAENRMLHLGNIWTALKIDDQVQLAGALAARDAEHRLCPRPRPARSATASIRSTPLGKLRITQTVEVVPGRKPGQKQRQRDTVLVRYTIENKDTVPHKVGMRKSMDVYIVDNDGALFAAPNQPGKILDGVELKGKTMPDYLQFLQRPNLQESRFRGPHDLHPGQRRRKAQPGRC